MSTRLEFGMVVNRSGWGRMRPECTTGDLVKFTVRGRHGSRVSRCTFWLHPIPPTSVHDHPKLSVPRATRVTGPPQSTGQQANLPTARRGPARRQMCRCDVENEVERLCGALWMCGLRWVSDGESVWS